MNKIDILPTHLEDQDRELSFVRPVDMAIHRPVQSSQTTSLVLDPLALERMLAVAEVMAKGISTIPGHLQKNPSDCLAIIMQSMQWKMNPYAVAQKTYVVHGVLGYEAQLINAVINSIAPVESRINYKWYGDWARIIGNFEIKRGDKGEYRVPGWKMADEEGLGVTVFATIKGENEPRELNLLLAQARTRNSSLWADDPKQQLSYLATKKWSRLHTPDVILGVYTSDEIEEFGQPAPTVQPKAKTNEFEIYSDEKFEDNFPTWEKLINEGKTTPERLIAKIKTKAVLTEAQIKKIETLKVQEKRENQEGEG